MVEKKEKPRADKEKGEEHKKANKERGVQKKGSVVHRLATGTVEKPEQPPRMKTFYFDQVVASILKDTGGSNRHAVPRLEKIVVNMGVSEAKDNVQALDVAREDLAAITGQRPQTRCAKKSISNFKLREGMPIAVRVTLRGARMYEFFDRLVMTAVPRIRDFRGLPAKGFDGRGNYNLGLREHHIFSEVDLERSPKALGMNISFVTTADNDDDGRDFLGRMGLPFKKDAEKKG